MAEKIFFYNNKTGKPISEETIKSAFEDKVPLKDVSVANQNMMKESQTPNVPEQIPITETPKKPEFEFFNMVNAHSNRVKSGLEVPHEPTNNQPEVSKDDAKTRMYYRACNTSVGISPDDPKILPKRDRNRKRPIARTVVSLSLAGIIAISGYTIATKIASKVEDNKALSTTRQTITQTAYNTSNPSYGIVKNNTHRTDDNQGFWYDNYAIAEDIIDLLPDSAFDATLYTVYLDMGPNVSNAYIDNFGRVISACGQIASPSDDPIAYSRTSDCHSFEDFARKNGYVDENGEPSMEVYQKFGMEAVRNYQAYGINAISDEAPQLGGRQ